MRKLICALLSVAIIFTTSSCGLMGKRLNYEDAKAETIELFNENKDDFLSVAEEIEDRKVSSADFTIQGIESIYCKQDETNKLVNFLKAHGSMLGGQYWGLYYSANNKPENDWGVEVQSGPYEGSFYWSEPNNGGDFFATERIEECWFFYYFDFDGNSHELDWANK